MRYALVMNGAVINVTDLDPNFANGLTGFQAVVPAPDGVVVGATYDGSTFVNPDEAPEPGPAPEPRRLLLTPAEFRNSFSAFEEVAIVDFSAGAEAETDAQAKTIRRVVGVFFNRLGDPHLSTVDLADPRNLAGLDLLVSAGILTPARRATIAAGLAG